MLMQKQTHVDSQFEKSRSKGVKYSKLGANNIVRQAVTQLQKLYTSAALYQNNGQKSLYLLVIDLTWQVCANFCACSKHITNAIDIADILMNNFILGTKLKYDSMVGGFVYIGVKYVNQGLNNLLYHLNSIKDVVHNNYLQLNVKYSISNQFFLVFQNLNTLIIPNPIEAGSPWQKVERLIFNALMCLIRVFQQINIKYNAKSMSQKQISDLQQQFYHRSLKATKICKMSKKMHLYKQLLASYYKFISQNKIVPTLDICRLLIDALYFNKEFQVNKMQQKQAINDEQLTGFLIRKCFCLIGQNYSKNNFYIEDHTLTQTCQICLSSYPQNKKNTSQIFHTMLKIHKIILISDSEYWQNFKFVQCYNKNQKQLKGQYANEKRTNLINVYKYISSIHDFLQRVVMKFNQIIGLKQQQQSGCRGIMILLRKLERSMKNNIQPILQLRQQVLLVILDQIVSMLFRVNSQIFVRCQKKPASLQKQNRKLILDWYICAQIQNTIIVNPIHKQIKNSIYVSYQYHNAFILLIKQLVDQNGEILHKSGSQKQNQWFKSKQRRASLRQKEEQTQRISRIMTIFKDNSYVTSSINNNPQKLYKYWDLLISYAANYLETVNSSEHLIRVSSILKQLISSKNMILLAHGYVYSCSKLMSSQSNKFDKLKRVQKNNAQRIGGIYNLLIILLKYCDQNLNNILQAEPLNQGNKQSNHKYSVPLQQKYNLIRTKSIAKQLMFEKKRIRSQLVLTIAENFVECVLNQLMPHLEAEKLVNNDNYAFLQILGYFLTIAPLVLKQLSINQRIYVQKIRKQIVSKIKENQNNKCRYIYNKNVAYLLQDYYNEFNNKDKYNERQEIFSKYLQNKAAIIRMYLQNYIHLFPQAYKNIGTQTINRSRASGVSRQVGRKSIKLREVHDIQIVYTKQIRTDKNQKLVHKQFRDEEIIAKNKMDRNNILYIDFIQWVCTYCKIKQILSIALFAQELLDVWLDGLTLQQYFSQLLQDTTICFNRYFNGSNQTESIDMDSFVIISQCVNKLIYINSNTKKPSSHWQKSKNSNENICENILNQGNKMSIQFQMQQCALRINHINKPIVTYSDICKKLCGYLCQTVGLIHNRNEQLPIYQYLSTSWLDCKVNSKIGISLNNYNRLIICLNNIISSASNIGHECRFMYNPSNKRGTYSNSVLQTLCMSKLLLTQIMQSHLQLYTTYSEMVFLNYIPLTKFKYQQIYTFINNYSNRQSNSSKISNQTTNTTKNTQNYTNSTTKLLKQSLQNKHIMLIKVYLGICDQSQGFQKILDNNYLIKLIYMLKKIKHMHPHKTLVRSISGHIFNIRQLNQQSILKYQQPLMPLTSSILQSSQENNSNNKKYAYGVDSKQQIKNIFQKCSNQIQHRIFEIIVLGILQCLYYHHQISQFKSILKLSIAYFIKANNVRAFLFALRCYQQRTKSLTTHQLTSNNTNERRRSHLYTFKVQSRQSTQKLLPLDMLSISDSFQSILQTIYNTSCSKQGQINKQPSFNKASYQKFCRLILGSNKNKRRTSMSFHVTFQSVLQSLEESMAYCHSIGYQLMAIFGDYACKVLQVNKRSKVYALYSQMYKNYNQYHLRQCKLEQKKFNIHELNSKILRIFKQTQFKLNKQEKVQLLQIQNYILNQIKQIIPFSYYHAQILQDYLSTILSYFTCKSQKQLGNEDVLHDKIVLQLSILMLDHNYIYKSMIETIQPIILTHSDNQTNFSNTIEQLNSKFMRYISNYHLNFEKKILKLWKPNINKLEKDKLNHALTIIYPFGTKVYIINVQAPILVITIDRMQFDEHISTVDTLIANNSRVLNDKNIDPKEWWKSRDRVDRSIGKITNQIDIGTWDFVINPLLFFEASANSQQYKLLKLIYAVIKTNFGQAKRVGKLIKQISIGHHYRSDQIQQMIIRVNNYIKSNDQINKYKPRQCQNLLLLTPYHYTLFPFQANSYLSRQRAVYRIPSIQYLMEQQQMGSSQIKIINISNTNYLVNSGNDLGETQKNFYKIKQNFPAWTGIIGRKPIIKQFLQLWQSEAYLYMGHGAGTSHLRQRQFCMKKPSSLMMLFGCSSASISQGKCEHHGISHSHLINGSSVLGCLWEVTDRDTDKLTENIFKSISKSPQNLSKILSNSKKKCKHQFLNGGAIVIFGLPVYVYSA